MGSNTLDEALINLRFATSKADDGDAKAFDEALVGVTQLNDPEYIAPILLMLNDGAQYDEGMFSLIHAAEAFDDDTYVHHLLKILPELRTKAPKWASIVLMRVLNSQGAKDSFVRALRATSPDVKKSVEWLCEKINERNPTFLSKTLAVLMATK